MNMKWESKNIQVSIFALGTLIISLGTMEGHCAVLDTLNSNGVLTFDGKIGKEKIHMQIEAVENESGHHINGKYFNKGAGTVHQFTGEVIEKNKLKLTELNYDYDASRSKGLSDAFFLGTISKKGIVTGSWTGAGQDPLEVLRFELVESKKEIAAHYGQVFSGSLGGTSIRMIFDFIRNGDGGDIRGTYIDERNGKMFSVEGYQSNNGAIEIRDKEDGKDAPHGVFKGVFSKDKTIKGSWTSITDSQSQMFSLVTAEADGISGYYEVPFEGGGGFEVLVFKENRLYFELQTHTSPPETHVCSAGGTVVIKDRRARYEEPRDRDNDKPFTVSIDFDFNTPNECTIIDKYCNNGPGFDGIFRKTDGIDWGARGDWDEN